MMDTTRAWFWLKVTEFYFWLGMNKQAWRALVRARNILAPLLEDFNDRHGTNFKMFNWGDLP